MVIVGVLLGVSEGVCVTGMRVMVADGSDVNRTVAVFGAAVGAQAVINNINNIVNTIFFWGNCALGCFLIRRLRSEGLLMASF